MRIVKKMQFLGPFFPCIAAVGEGASALPLKRRSTLPNPPSGQRAPPDT